jgi:DNA-binding MarR family transcriptional regulator
MIAERTDFEVDYKRFERAALMLLDGEHRAAALAWLAELNQHVDKVIDSGALERVVDWSARLDRLAGNLPDADLSERVRGYLNAMLDRLDRSAAALSQQRDVEERKAIASGVRERVLTLIAERPRLRSGEIAETLGIARSQASRALRELQQRGLVFPAEPDPADHDTRVRRYVAAPSAQAA